MLLIQFEIILFTTLVMQASLRFSTAFGISNSALSNASEVFVDKRTVKNAWQSSAFDEKYCFSKRDVSKESDLLSGVYSYYYFHSKNKSSAVDGYHWLVLQLNSTFHVTAVKIHGRKDKISGNGGQAVYNRGADIEIWLSETPVDFPGADHCTAVNISKYFNITRSQWNLCGVTKNENIAVAENLTVNCTKLLTAQMLLFRRSVQKTRTTDDYYMSFAGVSLIIGEPEILDQSYVAIIVACSSGAVLAVGFCILVALKRCKPQSTISAPVTLKLGNEPCIPQSDDYSNDEADPPVAPMPAVAEMMRLQSSLQNQELNSDCDYATVLSSDGNCAGSGLDLTCSCSGSLCLSDTTEYLSIAGDESN